MYIKGINSVCTLRNFWKYCRLTSPTGYPPRASKWSSSAYMVTLLFFPSALLPERDFILRNGRAHLWKGGWRLKQLMLTLFSLPFTVVHGREGVWNHSKEKYKGNEPGLLMSGNSSHKKWSFSWDLKAEQELTRGRAYSWGTNSFVQKYHTQTKYGVFEDKKKPNATAMQW